MSDVFMSDVFMSEASMSEVSMSVGVYIRKGCIRKVSAGGVCTRDACVEALKQQLF